ncbi:MAG: CoA-binding protein [Thermodesulfobacteriota bacterium]|nr:MAG: CoA-binding protein [Thermodesulfobacteriota bacterium]
MNLANPSTNTTDDEIKKILSTCKTVAVVGLSARPERASFAIASFLKVKGFRVVPVNPGLDAVLGEKCYPALSAIPFPVDIVDVFRKSEAVPEIAAEAVKIGAKVLWLQLGVINIEAVEKYGDDITIIMDRCIKVEYSRLFGAGGV